MSDITGPIKNIVFDLDGTLIDSFSGIQAAIYFAFEKNGIAHELSVRRDIIGSPIRNILNSLAGGHDDQLIDRLEYSFRQHYDSVSFKQTSLFPGAMELLQNQHKNGLSMFVLTNKPEVATHRILKHLKIDGLFTTITCKDSRKPSFKTKSEALASIALEWGLSPKNCILVGDSDDDAAAAADSNIPFISVDFGYGGASHSRYPICKTISSLAQIESIAVANSLPTDI